MYRLYIKRFFDVVFALIALVFVLVPMIIVFIVIKIDSSGPAIFTQKRVGMSNGEIRYFYIYKFRTMYSNTPGDVPTHLLENREKYITRVGRFLRKTSLDELPQIFNILKGDMSVVGPRPALYNQYDLISEREKNGADKVLPGLTGWAQVNGRDGIDVYEKARLDGEYAENVSLAFDLKCLFLTVKLLLLSHDPEYDSANQKSVLE